MEKIIGIKTKQGDMGVESLRRELLDDDEYDPLFGSNTVSYTHLRAHET